MADWPLTLQWPIGDPATASDNLGVYMALFNNDLVVQLLASSAALFFLVWGVVALAIGVGLIVRSASMFRLFALMNTYVSTRRGLKSMAVPRSVGPAVLKYRHWFGSLFAAGAAYSIFALVTGSGNSAVASMLGTGLPGPFVSWLVEALRWFLGICNAFALIIGLMLVFFPDTFGAIEERANRWYSFRQLAPRADTMHLPLDRWVEAFPRAAGWIIALSALGLVVEFGLILFRHA